MKNTLKDRLLTARTHAGLSQKQLADAANVSQGVVSHLESGESKGSKHLVKFANIMMVNPTWLSEGRGDMLLSFTYPDGTPPYYVGFKQA